MAVKLIDLQIIYGLMGARGAFEDLAFDLIKAEEPRAQKVRVSQGDGGIDAHVNDLSDPGGVHVYQCKFFRERLEDSQKGQIRDSFKRCRTSTDYRLKRWTLCLPVDLSVPERLWFEGWREDQKSHGVVIDDPWGSSILENLLHQDKNKGLRDDYFKQEFVAQIGEMHGNMQRLLARVEEVIHERDADRSQARQVDIQKRFAQFAERVAGEVRLNHVEALRQANRAGPQPGQWEVIIRPSWLHDQPRHPSLRDCLAIVQRCQVGPSQLPYPEVIHMTQTVGQDWAGGWYAHNGDVECWHFATKEVFAHVFTVPEENSHQHGFAIDHAVLRLMQMFRFAKALAEKAFDTNDGRVEVTIHLLGIRGRTLILPRGMPRGDVRGAQDQIDHAARCKREELLADPDSFALKAALHFFERFGWLNVREDVLAGIQDGWRRHF